MDNDNKDKQNNPLEKPFSGVRRQWLPLYQKLHKMVAAKLGNFEEYPSGNTVLWKHLSTFAELQPKKSGLTVAFPAASLHEEWHPDKTIQTSKNRTAHYFTITDEAPLQTLAARIEAGYALTQTGKTAKQAAARPPKTTYKSVDEYIQTFPPNTQQILIKIRQTIQTAAPNAVEKTSWQMPTYWQGENLVHFAAQKSHIGFYPSPEGIIKFAPQLKPYKTTKGGVQFPLSQPIPYKLIEEITRWRVQMVEAEAAKI